MSSNAIKVIRDAEKSAAESEKNAKDEAAKIIQTAQMKAKDYVTSKANEAKAKAEASLAEQEKANEGFMKKAEAEIAEEVKKLRSQAEAKKKGVVNEVNNFLF